LGLVVGESIGLVARWRAVSPGSALVRGWGLKDHRPGSRDAALPGTAAVLATRDRVAA